MSVQELFSIVEQRGMKIVLREDGTPTLTGKTSELTPELLAALKRYKSAVVAALTEEAAKNAEVPI
jgi:hypothetical protein